MVIEHQWSLWKPSLFTQYRIRVTNELRLAQHHDHCQQLREQIVQVENDITELLQQMTPIDFTQLGQEVHSHVSECQTEEKRTRRKYRRVQKQLIHLQPKLLVGHAYLCAGSELDPIPLIASNISRKPRKRLKLSIEQRWRQGIRDVYRRLQTERDQRDTSKQSEPVNNLVPIEPLPETPPVFDEVLEHEFLPPLPPPPQLDASEEMIIAFQTPPLPPIAFCRSPLSDRFQLPVDDTIVKPHRLVNKTLCNITQMSFHIDPDHCSSPKANEKKRKKKLIQFLPPPPPPSLPPPAPPQFSSTAIFDSHAFFTQTGTKTKKQKKKIDIARQPAIVTSSDTQKKSTHRKKRSPYDFQDEENATLSRTKGSKLLTDDIITARFAKNSHYQSHQTSMASTKSSRSTERKSKKKRKGNLLGIGASSPLTLSANQTLSPGRLSADDDDEDFQLSSTRSRRQHHHHHQQQQQRKKTSTGKRRTRVK